MSKIKKILFIIAIIGAFSAPSAICSEAFASGTEISVQSAPAVKAVSGGVDIDIPGDKPRQVAIYALTGQVVKQASLNPGTNHIELPSGYYIVRIGHNSVKVIVK